ncbi:transcriptional regulator [Tamlana sedimentorum]|uniref:Transcriptional regulator n=1 Tax=Neotamlana sedimentorum TaxID=1435349 RepID=A0A0D7W996_9FLAO|nr:AraC family transcriptional regulator [Tamlana sedimentorum]KJD35659.1 transcriptional regulator [Tamlana sedimentorum]
MALNLKKFFLSQPHFNKLVSDDYMFVEFNCPIEMENFKLWTEIPFLAYVVSGRKDWTALDKTYNAKEGDALFIRKGVYNTKQYFEEDYCSLLFFITDDFVRRFCKEYHESIPKVSVDYLKNQIYEIDVNDPLRSLFLTVFNYLKTGKEIPRGLVEMKFKELLFNISLNPSNKELIGLFNSIQHVEKTNLIDVMMKNFQSDLNLEDYARLSGRSLSTFKRDFQNHFKETPGKWLNNKRLEYAKLLLQNEELNINDICWESGFKNTSHFNSSFKEKYQLPPNQYRKQYFQK